MRSTRCPLTSHAVFAATLSLCAYTHALAAQGCEPIRFTTPVNLGGGGKAYQPGHEWEFTLAYRHLESGDWYVGSSQAPALAPFGTVPVFKIHTFVGDVSYSINDRLRVHFSIPFQQGTLTSLGADKAVHEQRATGVGDVSAEAESWLLDPRTHESGNVAIGLGVKAPTGSHTTPTHDPAAAAPNLPADQTIQPSDGGWAILTQANAFRRVAMRTFVYGFGSYMISPRAQSDVARTPGVFWSVPDVYSARLGAAFDALDNSRLTLSLGGRIDGIPVHDLIGGGDDSTIKRTARVIFVDPGLSFVAGHGRFTLSAPVRVSVNRVKSLYEIKTNGLNGGGFANYLVFVSYSYRL